MTLLGPPISWCDGIKDSPRLPLTGQRHRLADAGSALNLVPGEAPAFDGALKRLEQHQRKQLAIGEALQPNVAEEEKVAATAGLPSLEGEGDRGSDKVDHHEQREVDDELVEVSRVGRLRMTILVDEVADGADGEHDVDEGRDQGQQDLEDDHVWD